MLCLVRLVAVLGLIAALPACTTIGLLRGEPPSRVSVDAAQVSLPVAKVIAADLVANLAQSIGPGTTTIALASDDSPFAGALESSLRERGYAVAVDAPQGKGGTPLSYTLDSFEDAVLARLATPNLSLARAYAVSGDTAEPGGSLSILRRD